MTTRYVQIEYRPGGKLYAFSYDGPDTIEVGVDRVEIQTREGLFMFAVKGVLDELPDDVDASRIRPITRVMPRVAVQP